MTRDEFWRHIHSATARSPESPEAGLRDELLDLTVADLIEFQEHFDRLFDDAYRWDLWAPPT